MLKLQNLLTLLLAPCTLTLGAERIQQDRPFIWSTVEERPAILEKVETEPWAKSLFDSLKERADIAVGKHSASRFAYLRELPLDWSGGNGEHPPFHTILDDRPGTEGYENRLTLMTYLQDSVDCGVMYFLTEDESYARCAADLLATGVLALNRMETNKDPFNGGWIYPSDHLKEARIFGAQWPIVYDLIHPYIREGGKVMNVVTGKEEPFPCDEAQKVFRTYVELAINRGIIDANWPVLESPSLVHNLLALDDASERQGYLPYYLERDVPEQDSLRKVASFYEKPGDMWPESLQYSLHVTQFSVYLMTVLDRLYPDLQLGRKYSNIGYALAGVHYLEFPNGDVVGFGDGKRRYKPPYVFFEFGHKLATLDKLPEQAEFFGSLIKTGLKDGSYDRGKLPKRRYGASPYFMPLQLLWLQEELKGSEREYPRYRSESLPFAGIYIQRNQAGKDPVRDNLMAWVGGAHYVHGHASGMNIELYGKGEVLGHDGGKGKYRTDVHENYYRLFAAHNTVISNGASAASGGWVELGIPTIELVTMEPMPRQVAVSKNHSFSTTRFEDKHNLVAPALHERTLAVIRTSPTTGYYVDVFRAKSDTEAPFHDYVYRNLGESLSIEAEGKLLPLGEDDGRYSASADRPWIHNNTFRHPGWHFFENVQISDPYMGPVEATFFAGKAGSSGIGMHLFLNAGENRSYSSVLSPDANLASVRYYMHQPAPTLVIRQPGNAWKNPFVAVFEPFEGKDGDRSVKAMEPLQEDGEFVGLVVDSVVEGNPIQQVILIHEDEHTRSYPQWDIQFAGHFAVITYNKEGRLIDVYIGDGQSLTIGDQQLNIGATSRSALFTP